MKSRRSKECIITNICQLEIETVNTQHVGANISECLTFSPNKIKAVENYLLNIPLDNPLDIRKGSCLGSFQTCDLECEDQKTVFHD